VIGRFVLAVAGSRLTESADSVAASRIAGTDLHRYPLYEALPVEVTLNRNNPRYNSVYFATLRQFKTLYMSSEYIYISF
jgi:hypothetical protein